MIFAGAWLFESSMNFASRTTSSRRKSDLPSASYIPYGMLAWSPKYTKFSAEKSGFPSEHCAPVQLSKASAARSFSNTVMPPVPESNTPMGSLELASHVADAEKTAMAVAMQQVRIVPSVFLTIAHVLYQLFMALVNCKQLRSSPHESYRRVCIAVLARLERDAGFDVAAHLKDIRPRRYPKVAVLHKHGLKKLAETL